MHFFKKLDLQSVLAEDIEKVITSSRTSDPSIIKDWAKFNARGRGILIFLFLVEKSCMH